MKEIIDRACDIECVTESDAKAVAALADLAVQLQSRLESLEKDAARWHDISYALNRGISGAGYGRRFKIVEICPMHGDAKEVSAIDVISAMQANKGE